MDQLTPFYDNTPADSFFPADHDAAILSDGEINKLVLELIADVDLPCMLNKVFTLLKQRLSITNLQLLLPDSSLSIGKHNDNNAVKTNSFDISTKQISASINYQFSAELSVRQRNLLLGLHSLLKRPLQLALDYHAMQQMAMRDHLTGLGNRASYQEAIQRSISAAKRQKIPFSILVIDLDKFKSVNDTHGHPEGDKVLLAVANILYQNSRDTDYAFRLGGDEFCCLLSDSNRHISAQLADRIKYAVEQDPLLSKYAISCSIGSADYRQEDDAPSLFARADAALYHAKKAGRDCHIAA